MMSVLDLEFSDRTEIELSLSVVICGDKDGSCWIEEYEPVTVLEQAVQVEITRMKTIINNTILLIKIPP